MTNTRNPEEGGRSKEQPIYRELALDFMMECKSTILPSDGYHLIGQLFDTWLSRNEYQKKKLTEYAQQREQPWVRVDSGELPPKKEGWNHSNKCLVWYDGQPNVNVEIYGIAYYNYEPPLNYPPEWVDFHNYGRKPTHWQKLPPAPPKD